MFGSLEVLNRGFNDFLDQGDPRVKDWPLMKTPFPAWAMIAAYVYFVKVAGPRYMKKRQPYELRTLMAVYNFALVFLNMWIFLGIGWYGWFNGYSLKCQLVDYSNNHNAVRMAEMGYCFYITKFVEFADTIFFVLRKKDSQISALHVIHHSIVPFSLWFGIKFAPGGYNAFFPFLNALVHVIMYTYYGLAALGERYKKYLVWKKYMTYIQMLQFVGVIIYAMSLYFNGCAISKAFIAMNFVHALLFFGLFLNFFLKNYSRKPPTSKCVTLVSKEKPYICKEDHEIFLHDCSARTSTIIHRVKQNGFSKNVMVQQNGHYANGSLKKLNGLTLQATSEESLDCCMAPMMNGMNQNGFRNS